MQFAYTILYVSDVPNSLKHYEAAYGCAERFLHESKMYGELETGPTVLAFAALEMAEMNDVAMRVADPKQPTGPVNLTFATNDVGTAYSNALENGATAVVPPTTKPWGQVACYVRDIDGHLVEIATPLLRRHGGEGED
ncbi:MAG: VOC family protein [Pseudomonadota bacterium]